MQRMEQRGVLTYRGDYFIYLNMNKTSVLEPFTMYFTGIEAKRQTSPVFLIRVPSKGSEYKSQSYRFCYDFRCNIFCLIFIKVLCGAQTAHYNVINMESPSMKTCNQW